MLGKKEERTKLGALIREERWGLERDASRPGSRTRTAGAGSSENASGSGTDAHVRHDRHCRPPLRPPMSSDSHPPHVHEKTPVTCGLRARRCLCVVWPCSSLVRFPSLPPYIPRPPPSAFWGATSHADHGTPRCTLARSGRHYPQHVSLPHSPISTPRTHTGHRPRTHIPTCCR